MKLLMKDGNEQISQPNLVRDKTGVQELQPTIESTSAATSRRKLYIINLKSSFDDDPIIEREVYNIEDKLDNKYEPYEHRQLKKPTTDCETIVHILTGVVSVNIMTAPMAFQDSGVVVGTSGCILLGVLCTYGIHIMIRMQHLQCKWLHVPFLSLPKSMKIAFLNGPQIFHQFAWIAPYFVDLLLVANQVGICASTIAFIAHAVKMALDPFTQRDMDTRLIILWLFLPVLLMNYIPHLKGLTIVSFISTVLMIIVLLCCIYYFLFDGRIELDNAELFTPIYAWPISVGILIEAFESVPVVLSLEHNMKNPQHFVGSRGLYPWTMGIIMIVFMLFGLAGYVEYGGEKYGFTVLCLLPENQWVSNVARTTAAIAGSASLPLQSFALLEIIWNNYLSPTIKNKNYKGCIEYLTRTLVVTIIFLLALAVPNVDLLISLVGSSCVAMLGLVIPFVLELCTKYPNNYGYCNHTLVKDVLLIIIGLCLLVTGTAVSVKTVFDSRRYNHNDYMREIK